MNSQVHVTYNWQMARACVINARRVTWPPAKKLAQYPDKVARCVCVSTPVVA